MRDAVTNRVSAPLTPTVTCREAAKPDPCSVTDVPGGPAAWFSVTCPSARAADGASAVATMVDSSAGRMRLAIQTLRAHRGQP